MDEKRLTEIEERASRAIPGPWEIQGGGGIRMDGSRDYYGVRIGNSHFYPIANRTNADFIAHSREDIPILCAALRQAWRERDREKAGRLAAELRLAFELTQREEGYLPPLQWAASDDSLERGKALAERLQALEKVAEAAEKYLEGKGTWELFAALHESVAALKEAKP